MLGLSTERGCAPGKPTITQRWVTQIFWVSLTPEDILCDGCFVGGEQTLDSECPVRPCVIEHKVKNCAECDDYVCEKLADILVDFDELQAKFDQPFPEAERQRFLFPHEYKQWLAEMRETK